LQESLFTKEHISYMHRWFLMSIPEWKHTHTDKMAFNTYMQSNKEAHTQESNRYIFKEDY